MKNAQEEYNTWFKSKLNNEPDGLFSRIGSKEFEGVTCFFAEIDPASERKRPIELTNYGCELTVFYDGFHTHLDMFEEDDHDFEFSRAIELIKDIQAEEVVVVKSYENIQTPSVMLVDHDEIPAPEEGIKQETVSWLGTYNKTVKV